MKVSDYITRFLIEHEITDVFGYPGGMITYLMDSFDKHKSELKSHVNYHEQASAFAACGYAQVSLKPGVAYTSSGPGATNLMTGIANAYFDSIPTIFITGQVNTYEAKGTLPLRQKGFQEMDVVSLASSITKYCVQVATAEDVRYHLEKAYYTSMNGRPGPVLLDIPMNIQRADIDPEKLHGFEPDSAVVSTSAEDVQKEIYNALQNAKRPCILVGAGVRASGTQHSLERWVNHLKIPVVSSMLAVDVLPNSPYYYQFVGAYGARHANFILAKSDLIICLGSRMDLRQTGANTDNFAINAKLIRIDIDDSEFSHKVKPDEKEFCINLKTLLPVLAEKNYLCDLNFSAWTTVCDEIKNKLDGKDNLEPNQIMERLSKKIEKDVVITTDVGQNQVWTAQSFIPTGQRILFSGGHGAMGYSLPAAIGAHYALGQKVVAFTGDGGLQMNIQELQFIARENLPILIILLNNTSLGMIRHFQEMYFDSNYVHTKKEGGYTTPNFQAIAVAYQIPYYRLENDDDLNNWETIRAHDGPVFLEIVLQDTTYVFPKLAMGKLNQDQDPELDRTLYEYLSKL